MDMPTGTTTKRAGTAQQWLLADPVLAEEEVGIETDTHLFKVGDGVTKWSGLNMTRDPQASSKNVVHC